jgi:hypothetical protein
MVGLMSAEGVMKSVATTKLGFCPKPFSGRTAIPSFFRVDDILLNGYHTARRLPFALDFYMRNRHAEIFVKIRAEKYLGKQCTDRITFRTK